MGDVEIEQQLRQVYDNMPDDVRSSTYGSMVNKVLTVIGSTYSFSKAFIHCSTFNTQIDNLDKLSETVGLLVDNHKNTLTELFELKEQECYHFFDYYCDKYELNKLHAEQFVEENKLVELKKKLLSKIEKEKKTLAHDTVMNSAKTACIGIFLQSIKLFLAVRAISEADNILEDSRTIIEDIRTLMNDIDRDSRIILNNMDDVDNPIQAMRLNFRIIPIQTKINVVRNMIGDVKVNINGKVEKLKTVQENQVVDGMMNFLNTFAHAAETIITWKECDNYMRFISTGVTSMYAILTIGNASVVYITGKKLRELRIELNNIRQIEGQLEGLQLNLTHASERLLQMME